jgi:hypothetical protein
MVGRLALIAILSACQQSVQGQQLDTNYATTTGIGSATGVPVKLPHGRYTFFSSADPPSCVTSVALLDQAGHAVADDAAQRAAANQPAPGAPPGVQVAVDVQTVATMVQQELSSGSYRLKVTTTGSGCAWQVEQILNYMLSDEPPLKAIIPPSAPAVDVRLGVTSSDRHFHVGAPGIYKVDWAVTACDKYSGDLVRTDGGTIHLGDGQAVSVGGGQIGPQVSSLPMFLGAGDWTAKVSTRCFWQIDVVPWRGSTGGGGQGFHG